ncbi:MAG: hypothetical protein A2381_13605 [Bdellovibrionales bacterium RIFOXYB1_FULL_37_110]|nr:MAG: hypothetical protein A2417_05240 [Bdellovibrionales bacterium RIFOXYC1_FULL_37_79]OFZ56897.1 MAG: hypothetical protein A2381_13605 [Bdellovibrionales bacterium RIFOXYB1_FULL_37_110]OFZ61984.1 MAG: hypothetical protein A2577_19075 [Bdellovibrionales bacterium RIFOXYD1_FULL_36_51]
MIRYCTQSLIIFLIFTSLANSSSFQAKKSISNDAILLLNILSDNENFYSKYLDVKKYWEEKFLTDVEARNALNELKGNGVGLSYLLTYFLSDNLDDLISSLENFDQTISIIKNQFDEQVYFSTLQFLETHGEELKTYIKFLRKNNFSTYMDSQYGKALSEAIVIANQALSKIDSNKFDIALGFFIPEKFFNSHIPRIIYIPALAGYLNGYEMMGLNVALSKDSVDELHMILPHELCHKFEPFQKNIDFLKQLAKEDEYYKGYFNRIYNFYNEAYEEEFVYAAGAYVAVYSGLQSYKFALRNIKGAYPETNNLFYSGVPIAGIIFNQLHAFNPTSGFNYNDYINELFETGFLRANTIEVKFKDSISIIGGIAGLGFEVLPAGIMITQLYEGYPAYESGLKVGDNILSINDIFVTNLNKNEILSLIMGPKGEEKKFVIKRNETALSFFFHLK